MTTLPSATSYFKYKTCVMTSYHNLAPHAGAKQSNRKLENLFRNGVHVSGSKFLTCALHVHFHFFMLEVSPFCYSVTPCRKELLKPKPKCGQ